MFSGISLLQICIVSPIKEVTRFLPGEGPGAEAPSQAAQNAGAGVGDRAATAAERRAERRARWRDRLAGGAAEAPPTPAAQPQTP